MPSYLSLLWIISEMYSDKFMVLISTGSKVKIMILIISGIALAFKTDIRNPPFSLIFTTALLRRNISISVASKILQYFLDYMSVWKYVVFGSQLKWCELNLRFCLLIRQFFQVSQKFVYCLYVISPKNLLRSCLLLKSTMPNVQGNWT